MPRPATLTFALALGLAVGLPGISAAQAPTNLKVLPATMPRDSVVARMRQVAAALGVQCMYCHVRRAAAANAANPAGTPPANAQAGVPPRQGMDMDFAADDKPTKLRAREMMRLTMRINQELLPAALHGDPSIQVRCVTCHRGAPRPVLLEDTLHTVIASAGVDSALSLYQRLRTRYANGFAYDFSEVPLLALSARLEAGARAADARRILEFGARQYPQSANVAFELGRSYEAAGEKEEAVAQYRRVLELRPNHAEAKRRLEALAGG